MANQTTTASTAAAPATGSACGCGSIPAAAAEASPTPAAEASPTPAAEAGPTPAASPCCGTAEGAANAGACCDPGAKTEALAVGASCCG